MKKCKAGEVDVVHKEEVEQGVRLRPGTLKLPKLLYKAGKQPQPHIPQPHCDPEHPEAGKPPQNFAMPKDGLSKSGLQMPGGAPKSTPQMTVHEKKAGDSKK